MTIVDIPVRLKEKLLLRVKRWNKNLYISPKIDRYLCEQISKELTQSENIAYRNIVSSQYSGYQTPLTEVRFLEVLAKTMNAETILEIGTFAGFTSMRLAKACGSTCKVYTCEIDNDRINKARELWTAEGVANQIEVIRGDAKDELKTLIDINLKFDLVYIDADKKGYPEYYELALQLTKKGSVIIIDNALWAGLVAEPNTTYSHAKIIDKLNGRVLSAHPGQVSLIPAWDGALMILI